MVSDFIDEMDGYLCHDGKEARVLLETQTEGYFNNDKFLEQVKVAIDIFEAKYPNARAVFTFDNAPCHRKVSDDALNAEKMNVKSGGKQPIMRDTEWNGQVQKMTLPDGTPKGMKLVLQEREIDVTGMNAAKMREVLAKHPDFASQKSIVEELIESKGHICLFFPKFHCELNPTERCWCHAKKHTRSYCNGSIARLRLVPTALDMCNIELIRKFFRTCRDYEKAYRNGCTCRDVDETVKVYKSHRHIFSINQ